MKPDCIIRTNRRSMSLTISKSGEIIVRAPRKLPINKILEFVNEKEKWIKKHLETIRQSTLINNDIKTYDACLLLGTKYKLKQFDGLKKIEFCDKEIIYPLAWDKEIFKQKMKKKYKELAQKILGERIEYFGKLMQLNYNSFAVKNYKAKWGCCSKDNNITINYKAIMLPHHVIDYIIIHELCHIIEFNHSPKFYKLIEAVMPNWKNARKDLKTYNYLIELY